MAVSGKLIFQQTFSLFELDQTNKREMYSQIHFKLIISIILSILICSFSQGALALETYEVSPCEVITFKIKNSAKSGWDMENVSTWATYPYFVTHKFGDDEISSRISKGGASYFVLRVRENAKEGDNGTVSLIVFHNMKTKGTGCTPEFREKRFKIKVAEDTDNSDPTYIQLPEETSYDVSSDTGYFLSPDASPGNGDSLDIHYNLSYNSYVTIQIYDAEGNLIRTLVNNQFRGAGEAFDTWDGQDEIGEYVSSGIYMFVINGVNAIETGDTWTLMDYMSVDNDPPLAEIGLIKADVPVYNSYTIIGSVYDEYLDYFELICTGNETSYTIATGTNGIDNDVLGVLDATDIKCGEYTLTLTVYDYAGNASSKTMPIIIGNYSEYYQTFCAFNTVKRHINSITQTISKDIGEGYKPASDDPIVWFDDDLPEGSTPIGDWKWETSIRYSGLRSHTDTELEGTHGHYFIHADEVLQLSSNDNIIQYIYLDTENPPQEILLQFYINDGDSMHRAYWGENLIPSDGSHGTKDLYHMGRLPAVGEWVRLKIPATVVGLNGQEIKGIGFVAYGGRAYWDKTTKSSQYNETQRDSWILANKIAFDNKTETVINYSTSQDANITLSIYDEEENLITTLIDEYKEKGNHQIVWDGTDSSGSQVTSGRYYFQFGSKDDAIESNAYGLMTGGEVPQTVEVITFATDSEGSRYEIDFVNQCVDKYDEFDNLLFSVTSDMLGVESFTPVAICLDRNDNLYISDSNINRIFKLNPHGYYLLELPHPDSIPWTDQNISLDQPNALLIDENGDLLVSNQNGYQTLQLAVGRGVIEISGIIAKIRVPYQNSLVSHSVPIIGTASASNFDYYTVEYGAGESPTEWTTIVTSTSEGFDDYAPIPPVRTVDGNLATWHTAKMVSSAGKNDVYTIPMGTYTIRLTVHTLNGEYKQDTVQVHMSQLIGSWEGILTSDDGLVGLSYPHASISDDFDLFSIVPVEISDAPPVDDPELTLVGNIYQIRPAGYKFLKPITLNMYYKDEQIDGIDENTLKIYRWNPIIKRWIYVYADLDTDKNMLSTTLTEFNGYRVYYAVMSDPPPAPVIYQPATPTTLENINVYGRASPSVKVEIFVNGVSQGYAQADENTGNFFKAGVLINEGDNYLTALALDPVGNTSPLSEAILVQFVMTQPVYIDSVSFKTEDFTSELLGEVTIGDKLHIELIGGDADPESVDSTSVTLKSSMTDINGIFLQLLETGPNTGIYRGTCKVTESSDAASGSIGVSASVSETITVTSEIDQSKQDSVNTEDRVPPPAPTIMSATHPSLCQDTFEFYLDEWANMSNSFGATVTRSADEVFSGNYSAKIVNTETGGDFANYVRTGSFDAQNYPIVSFDYKIPDYIKINLIAYVNGMWKEIVFTDDPKTVETFGDDLYRTIGYIEGVTADNTWRHAEFNLYTMLRHDDPNQSEYIVEELFFADYNLESWMEFIMGEENPGEATWYVDNFIISEGGKSNNDPSFSWISHDTSVVGYSYVLDQVLDTVPDAISEGAAQATTYTDIEDGIWYFHVRSVDGGGNWGPPNHYRIHVDATGPLVHSPEPQDGSLSGSLEVKIRIIDENGSGVNPDTIQLTLNDITYGMESGGLKYDEASGMLTFSLWKVFPVPDPWLNGETVNASLVAAEDFAGNSLQEVFSWSWTVDYSQLSGGYISLLTTQGGYTPSWSSDGTRIAFMSERSGNEDVWIINADDYAEIQDTARQLTLDAGRDHHPAWSPVDERIAFVSNREGFEHIFIVNSDGTGLTQLTSGEYDDSHPTWSDDGTRVVFSRGGEIWVIDDDGNNENSITSNSIEWNLEPVWSPDGTRIAFTKSLYVDDVALMGVDGDNMQVLTNSGSDFLPTWSKLTDQIVFVTLRDEKASAIWIMNSNGSLEENYIDNENIWWDSEPEQSPIDENIAFQSTRNGIWNIWVKTQLQLSDPIASPNPFSPNNDGIKDSTDISFNLLEGSAMIDLKIYDASDSLIVTLIDQGFGAEGENIVSWDGADSFGNVLDDSCYTYKISIEGSAGAGTIEKSGSVTLDTTPPSFSNFSIPDINQNNPGPLNISVTITDNTGLNIDSIQLQYGIAETMDETIPDVILWTDFGDGPNGTLDIKWSNYNGRYLYIRCYAEDLVGNAAYSHIQKRYIITENLPPIADAGDEQIVTEGETVTLDGSGSFDPDHGLASYKWSQITGSTVNLVDETDIKPTFTAPDVALAGDIMIFELRVTDVGGLQDAARVAIKIADSREITIYDYYGYEITELNPGLNLVSFEFDPATPVVGSCELVEYLAQRGHSISIHQHPLFFPLLSGKCSTSYKFFGKCCGDEFIIENNQIYIIYSDLKLEIPDLLQIEDITL